MKLSEAIRLGAMLRPQSFSSDLHDGGSCALMAAAEASGISGGWMEIGERWPWTDELGIECPVCGRESEAWEVIAVCLNDEHKCTREAIADWVATVEPQEEEAQPARQEAEVLHATV